MKKTKKKQLKQKQRQRSATNIEEGGGGGDGGDSGGSGRLWKTVMIYMVYQWLTINTPYLLQKILKRFGLGWIAPYRHTENVGAKFRFYDPV